MKLLFLISLEAALRDLRHNLPQRHRKDINTPHYIAYADDIDFISTTANSNVFLDEIHRLAPDCLLKLHIINESKTEHTIFQHSQKKHPWCWGMAKNAQTRLIASGCRKRDTEKAPCCSGFPRLSLRIRKRNISDGLQAYNAFIAPMWGLTPT